MANSSKGWQAWADHVAANLAPQVAQLLGVKDIHYKIVVDPTLPATSPASTDNNTKPPTITISAAHLEDVGNDPGEIAHELVHAATGNTEGSRLKVTEGMADAVRMKLGLTPDGWTPSKMASIFAALPPDQLQQVQSDIQDGTFNQKNLSVSGNQATYTSTTSGSGADPNKTTNANEQTGSPGVAGVGMIGQGDLTQPGQIKGGSGGGGSGSGKVITYTIPGTTTTITGVDTNGDGIPDVGANGSGMPVVSAGSGTTPGNFIATAKGQLSEWGIPLTPGLQNLIQQGAKQGWDSTTFVYHLEQQQEFHDAFPGIFAADGTLKMTPSDYLSTKASYISYAQQAGVDLNQKNIAYLFRNNVSASEYAIRAQAQKTLETNKQYFDAFNEQLKANGQQPLSKADQFKFIMGEGNSQWYDLWQQATTRYSGEESGLKFGHGQGYLSLSDNMINKISGLGLSQSDMQSKFAQMANDLLTTFPESKIQSYGLSKKDIREANFGGPKQAQVLQLMQHIMDTEKVSENPRANAQVFAKQGGGVETLGGAGERAQG